MSVVALPSAAADAEDPTDKLRALKREFKCASWSSAPAPSADLAGWGGDAVAGGGVQGLPCHEAYVTPTIPSSCRAMRADEDVRSAPQESCGTPGSAAGLVSVRPLPRHESLP